MRTGYEARCFGPGCELPECGEGERRDGQAQDSTDGIRAMIAALLTFFAFFCALFVWLWEQIDPSYGSEYDEEEPEDDD